MHIMGYQRRRRKRKNWFSRWIKRIRSIQLNTSHIYEFAKRLNQFARDRKDVSFGSKEEVRKALISALIFTTFLVANVIVLISPTDRYMYFFENRVLNAYVYKDVINNETNPINFNTLNTIPIYWDYMEYCVLNLFYGSNPQLSDEDKKNKTDTGVNLERNIFLMDNLIMGPPRIRQKRVANRSCSVPVEFSRYFDSCYAVYSDKVQVKSRLFKGTFYQSASKTFTLPITGKVATYSGGGYVQEFTWNASKNLEIMRTLRDTNWLDRGSRMVVYEYSLYNHNIRMYGQVQLVTEVMPTGFLVSKPIICTVKDYSYFDNPYISTKIALFVVYIMLIYYTLTCVTQIYFVGFKKHFSENINRLEVAVVILHIKILFYNLWHWHRAAHIANVIKTKRHISMDPLCTYYFYYINILGVLSILLMVQIFQFLQFNLTVKKFVLTVSKIYIEMFGFLVMFLIAFLAYAQLGILLFSKVHYGFQSFLFSIMTLTSMVLRNFDFTPLAKDYPITSSVFLISFIFIIFCILVNMFLAFIVATFAIVTAEIGEPESYLSAYLKDLLLHVYNCVIHFGRPPKTDKPKTNHETGLEDIDLWDERREMEFPEDQRKLRHQMRELDRIQRRTQILENFLNLMITNMDDLLKTTQRAVKKDAYRNTFFPDSKKK